MDLVHIIDTLIGIVVMGGAWFVSGMTKEQKRIEILLNRTREEYVTRSEVREDMSRVMEALHRVEDKLDRVLNWSKRLRILLQLPVLLPQKYSPFFSKPKQEKT